MKRHWYYAHSRPRRQFIIIWFLDHPLLLATFTFPLTYLTRQGHMSQVVVADALSWHCLQPHSPTALSSSAADAIKLLLLLVSWRDAQMLRRRRSSNVRAHDKTQRERRVKKRPSGGREALLRGCPSVGAGRAAAEKTGDELPTGSRATRRHQSRAPSSGRWRRARTAIE